MDDSQLLSYLDTLSRLRQAEHADIEVDDLLEATEAIERSTLEASLHAFVRAAWPVVEPGVAFVDGQHIKAICEHLERVTAGELLRLVINISPRSSKSTIVSVIWPAWVWARKPQTQWLCLSHSDKLSTEHSRKMRILVTSRWYQERWKVTFASDQNMKTRFDNDAHGYRIASSMRAGVTGFGGDVIVLDDPHDRDEAVSDTERKACVDAYREKISTRLNDPSKSAVVAIGQRLHQDDLFNYLLKSGFDVLTIPMLYERDHPFPSSTGWTDWRHADGELMCPERFPKRYVRDQELTLGSWGFAGQYQQRPTPRGGGLFKAEWFGPEVFVKTSPKKARRVRYWDKAASDAEDRGACYTSGVKIAEAGGMYYIEHVVRRRERTDGRRRMMRMYAGMDAQRDQATEQVIEREGGSTGKDAVMDEVRMLAGFIVRHHKPTGAKLVRAEQLAAQFEGGNVRIVEGKWNQEFVEELLAAFAGGKYLDQCDAASGALAWHRRAELYLATEDFVGAEDDRKPLSDDELAELPDFLRDLVTGHADLRRSNKQANQADADLSDDWLE